jgi:predicted transcriptional regulator
VLINPPYAEAENIAKGIDEENKDVAKTKVAEAFMENYGKASNELFVQFVARIAKEFQMQHLPCSVR